MRHLPTRHAIVIALTLAGATTHVDEERHFDWDRDGGRQDASARPTASP
jgi:hypothetical protein